MAFATTAIRYGWVYLTALGVITGTTIYVVDNQRHQIKPEDIIQIPLGITERCLATQYGTNSAGAPLYHVNPPSFIRTWKDANGASIVVTNTIGWHTDRDMMVTLDAKIKELVPYFIDPNSFAPNSNSFGSILTVTGLWATLQIGDKTNKFTRTPAIGTNAATYGDYPWQICVEGLQERYKVLNALKWSVDNTRQVTNQSWYGMIAYNQAAEDPWIYKYNVIGSSAKLITYSPSYEAIALGEKSEWVDYYKPTLGMYGQVSNYFFNNSNYSRVYQGFSTDGTYNVTYPMTWGQVSGTLIEGALWGFGNWQHGDFPTLWGNLTGWLSYPPLAIYERFHQLTARRTNSLSTVGIQVKPGTLSWVYKKPGVVGWSGGKFQGQWEWTFLYVTAKAKWMWWSPTTNAVPNTLVGVFAIGGFQTPSPMAPVHPVGITEIYSGSSNSWNTWEYPEEWQIDTTSPWGELAGLANTNYTKLGVSTDGNWLYMEFGGPGEVTGSLADMPPHPAPPIDSGNDGYWGSATFWDNAGSLGTAKGILVNEAYIVRDWDFQYCKTKFW